MEDNNPKPGWKQAFCASPGPTTYFEALILFCKGICMGAADIIPGVSGGTIAFITGVYQSLINAIASFDLKALCLALKLDIRHALSHVHLRFIIVLFSGVSLAILSTASLMHNLLEYHPIPTWSGFFGLILGSILIVFKEIKGWNLRRIILVIIGFCAAWKICGLIPVNTPENLWFLYLCGIIGICAMILPGISGSFLLLVLGKYYYITGALKIFVQALKLAAALKFRESYDLLATTGTFWTLVVFQLGQITGIIGFSRFLKWVLARWYQGTMCVLVGMMMGAMRKIWPWKHTLLKHLIDGHKEKVIEEALVLPWNYADAFNCKIMKYTDSILTNEYLKQYQNLQPQITTAILMAVVGISAVLILEKIASGKGKARK